MKERKEKVKQTESASFFKELGSFMKPYSAKYAGSVFLCILGVASNLGSYAYIAKIVSCLFEKGVEWEIILKFALMAVGFKILNALLINCSTWVSHKAAYDTLKDIRTAISEKLMKLPMGYFDENGSGRLKTMMVDHIENMEKTLAHMLPELTANLLVPAAMLVWMFLIDWRLALCVLIWIAIGFSVTGGMMKGYEEKFAGQIAAMKGMNQAVVEYVSGIEVIKNFGRADECYKKYSDAVYGHAAYNVNWQKETQVYSALGMAIAPFSIFPVLIAGLIFYSNNTLEASEFFLMIILTFGIFGPLMNAMNYFDQLAGMGTNAKEIRNVLEYPELQRGVKEQAEDTEIIYEDVSFSYTKDKKNPTIKNISFKIPKGTMLALVGPSGSGKSTIAKLLAGYWDADSGNVKIGGRSIKEYSQEALNQQIAYVDQETFLFDCSILDNIRMGCPSASDEEVINAAKRAGCHEFIEALPEGYHTMAGTAGGRLSGGERQRIAIARAMMKNAPIMILDEATSSSDPENEASIQTALSAAAKDKTLIVVAHRLPTIMHAEQIAFIKDGEIQNIGTHQQLLDTCQEYDRMWKLAKEG